MGEVRFKACWYITDVAERMYLIVVPKRYGAILMLVNSDSGRVMSFAMDEDRIASLKALLEAIERGLKEVKEREQGA